ncbi:Asp/Glu/hydantoin racemase [Variovorax robiniae]|uniref:Asp/Glu/hydantoin racemase n=1 Tax=Variovorax robiniae TaxID=1836199 RepID=A0ABU8XF59_9BURK
MSMQLDKVFAPGERFIGVVTPSGNTVVERVTMAILRAFNGVTPLFSRTPVFGESDPYPESYAVDEMLTAAHLLAHAKPDVMLWNGSKGAKIGVQHDRDYVQRVQDQTGIRTTTSILALDDLLRSRGLMRVAIVSPYDSAYQQGLVEAYREAGYEVIAERHRALKDNISFASIPADAIAGMVREAAAHKPDAVLTLCTNFPAATVIPAIEAETGIPMFDSVSIGVWHALRMAGIDTSPARAWGQVFAQ